MFQRISILSQRLNVLLVALYGALQVGNVQIQLLPALLQAHGDVA